MCVEERELASERVRVRCLRGEEERAQGEVS